MKKKIRVVETCPRDGWEHQPFVIPTEVKLKYIQKMIACGARTLDLVNFADPEKVPQMKDAEEVFQKTVSYVREHHLDVDCMALAFEPKGLQRALKVGATSLQYAFSASDKTNDMLGTTLEASLENMREIMAQGQGLRVKVGLLCAFGSPFGDTVSLDRLKRICEAAFSSGVAMVSLADTAGIASPVHVRAILEGLKTTVDLDRISLHVHNAFGMGLTNVFAAVEAGVTSVEGALGGLGGGPFPFIPGNHNLATEDIVNLLEASGYDTGYQLQPLIEAGQELCRETGAVSASHLLDKGDCLLCARAAGKGE